MFQVPIIETNIIQQQETITVQPPAVVETDVNVNAEDDTNENINISKKSSSKISIGIIIGIIAGVLVLTGGVIFFICYCKNKNKNKHNDLPSEESLKNVNSTINPSEDPFTMNNPDNKILITFETSGQFSDSISIESNKTIGELIKLYFEKIGKKDLIGEESIYFLMNGNIIDRNSTSLIKAFFNKYHVGTIIMVIDHDNKLHSNNN